MSFDVATNLSKLYLHDCYFLPGNAESFSILTNGTLNPQGVPANSTICRNMFFEGVRLVNIGDSNNIDKNVFRASGNRIGIYLITVGAAGGIAGETMITQNNIDCPGGAVYVERGRTVKFNYNNVELSDGSGTINGAVVDFDGLSGVLPLPEIVGNAIAVFGSATATCAINLNANVGAVIDNNIIQTGIATTTGILIKANSQYANVGLNNFNGFVNNFSDSGIGTYGIYRDAVLINSFVNTGGSYQSLQFTKDKNGIVTVNGIVTCPASPNGKTITTLPTGFAPLKIIKSVISTIDGGIASYATVAVDNSGNIIVYCTNTTTQLEINISFQTKNYVTNIY
jgi:hypothetical protein